VDAGRLMRVGFVHAGPPEHGVSRYGRLLAATAAARRDMQVQECELRLDGRSDRQQILAAAERLASADVVHLQYNNQRKGSVWGAGWQQLKNLQLFAAALRRPLVATVHDVYPVRPAWSSAVRRPLREMRRLASSGPQLVTRSWLQWRACRVFVCSEEERKRLSSPFGGGPYVIPHFVEPRELDAPREEVRRALGLSNRRVVTLLGFIHERKGHRLLIEALPHLPKDIVVVFAGSPAPGSNGIVSHLLAAAESLGVADRVRITGYLAEPQFEEYLIATDVAVCPFRSISASGSLSTWISAGRPIIASNLPQIAEYNALESGAIATFQPYSSQALAGAIRAVLDSSRAEHREALARLRARLLLPAVVNHHVAVYREVAGNAR
jgi:glycosyltransferase involved in cell wall biosynthesis